MSKRGIHVIDHGEFWPTLWRFVSGAPMDGKPRTDAGWLTSGTTSLTKIPVTRWSYRPRLQRAAIRMATVIITLATIAGYFFHRAATVRAWEIGLGATVAYGVWRGYREFRDFQHNRKYVHPMAKTLSGVLGLQLSKADKWLTVPPRFLDDDKREEVMIRVSDRTAYPADVRKTVHQVVAEKAGKGTNDFDMKWHLVGTEPYVSLRLAPRPPKLVTFSDIVELLEKATADKPLLGIAARSAPQNLGLDSDSPHAAFSCASGAGKSVLGRLLIAQWLRLGVQVIILDAKQVSQSWCKDLPGVTYCRTGKEMHNAIIAVADETKSRFELINRVPAEEEDSVYVGPRIILFFEEQNIGMQALADYWEEIKPKGAGKRSPAMKAIDYQSGAGRQAKAHLISIAQLFTVAACGGNPAARENYGERIMARATSNAWKMLAPECVPFPKINKRAGRMFRVVEGEAVEFQVPFLTVAEARAWATGGDAPVTVPATWTTVTTPGSDRPGQSVTEPTVTASVTPEPGAPAPEPTEPAPALYSLAEAAREGIVPMRYDQLRQAKSRDERDGQPFPKGVMVGKREKWTADQLSEWVQNRLAEAISDPEGGQSE